MTGHECPDCQFVAHRSCIIITPQQREQAHITLGKLLRSYCRIASLEEYVIPLSRFTLPGWSGHAMWYLFECPECEYQSVDYMHGHLHYLICQECDQHWNVRSRRFYDDSGIPAPPTFWQRIKAMREIQRRLRAEPQVRIHRDRLP